MHEIRAGLRQQNGKVRMDSRYAMPLRKSNRTGLIRVQDSDHVDLVRVVAQPMKVLPGNVAGAEDGGA